MGPMLRWLSVATLTLAWGASASAQSLTAPPATPLPDAAQAFPPGRSVWSSQDGSIVEITVDAVTGALGGTFTPGFSCESSPEQSSRPIVGAALGNAVAWSMSLPGCPSMGTWIGHYQAVGQEQQLSMLWTLAVSETPPGVGSTLTGAVIFVRQVR